MYKFTSSDLKLALLDYYRFKKQCIATDEVKIGRGFWDIGADSGKEVIEIETKISVSDLKNEHNKKVMYGMKHGLYKNAKSHLVPNRYYLCVPDSMRIATLNFIEEVNPKYGLITFDNESFCQELPVVKRMVHNQFLTFSKKSAKLHDRYSQDLARKIGKRASSKSIGMVHQQYLDKVIDL